MSKTLKLYGFLALILYTLSPWKKKKKDKKPKPNHGTVAVQEVIHK